MRRLPVEVALIIALALATGCGEREASAPASTPPAAGTTAGPQAPPPPPPPGTDEAAARTAALAMGPGTCEQDLPAIRRLPATGTLGVDAHFDRILVHRDAYKACLVAMVRDATPIADPGDGPKRDPYAHGDLAYEVLARIGFIQRGECLPPEVARADAQAASAWLSTTNHRRQLLRCLGKRLGS